MEPKRKRAPGAGRPPRDPAGRGSAVNLWLTPTERQHVERIGGGSPQAGVRVLIAASLKRRRSA